MHIPTSWAQARLRHESRPTHGVTVQRWGWSDTSEQAAQAHAQERARQALDQALGTSFATAFGSPPPRRYARRRAAHGMEERVWA